MKGVSVVQEWISELTFMQQSVLLSAIRGADGTDKAHPAKDIQRWFRRCVLYTSFLSDEAGYGVALTDPYSSGGGEFTGPVPNYYKHAPSFTDGLKGVVDGYFRRVDSLPHHFHMHLMHAAEIIGYKHPNEEIRDMWNDFYYRCCKDLHVNPETEDQLDKRLGDNENNWIAASK